VCHVLLQGQCCHPLAVHVLPIPRDEIHIPKKSLLKVSASVAEYPTLTLA